MYTICKRFFQSQQKSPKNDFTFNFGKILEGLLVILKLYFRNIIFLVDSGD